MATQKEIKQAQDVFGSVCDYLDANNWKYDSDREHLSIALTTRGDDLQIPIRISINVDLMVLSMYGGMPFIVPADMRERMAVAVTAATHCMVDGGFDYSVQEGKILFRITSTFRDSIIGANLIEYMLGCTCYMTDEFNDKFFRMIQEKMSTDDMLKLIYEEER